MSVTPSNAPYRPAYIHDGATDLYYKIGGGGGNKTALLVAASNAPSTIRNGADYLCDGTADDVEINAAITAANGLVEVKLSGGTFNLNATVSITRANTTLRGSGVGSTNLLISDNRNINAITVSGSGTNFVTLSDFKINGANWANTTGHGISVDTPYAGGTDAQHLFFNIDIWYSAQDAINVVRSAPIYTRVVRCISVRAKQATRDGFSISGTDGQFTSCIADACGRDGFALLESNNMFVGCKAFYCGANGFNLVYQRTWLTSCEAQNNYGHGFYIPVTGSGNVLTGCLSDTNAMEGNTTTSGLLIEGDSNSVSGGTFQHENYGITLSGTATGNVITGETILYSTIQGYRDISTGNNVHGASGGDSDLYIQKSGGVDGVMTGPLNMDNTVVRLVSPSGSAESALVYQTDWVTRWQMGKTGEAESTGNAGSNFAIARHADNGAWIDSPLSINRATGNVDVHNDLTAEGIWLNDPIPGSSNNATSKQYVDTRTPPILVLGPADPIPGGTPAGTLIVRRVA